MADNPNVKLHNFPKLPKNLAEFLSQKEIQGFMATKATEIRANSDKNLQAGKDVDGNAMKSYSQSYLKTLRENGESTTVDLTRTGQLLASRNIYKVKDGAEIRFSNARSGKQMARKSSRKKKPGAGGRSSISNPSLALELMKKGFDNWHAISKKDNDRITKEFAAFAFKMFNEYLKKNTLK